MSEVFLSHVEEDAPLALEIAIRLEAAGYSVWCYEVDSVPGPSYLLQTGQAIEQAKVFLLLISSHSLRSRQVTQEVVRAHESGKAFLPVLCGVTHEDFQHRQQEWREAVGAATSIALPVQGVSAMLPRLLNGLEALGLLPGALPDEVRMTALRQALADRQQHPQPLAGNPRRSLPPARAVSQPQPSRSSMVAALGTLWHRWTRWGLWAALFCVAVGVLLLLQSRLLPRQATELSTTSLPAGPSASSLRPAPSLPGSQQVTAAPSASPTLPAKVARETPPEPMATGAGQIRATMRLTPDGPVLNGYWRVYKAEGYELGERQQVTYSAEGQFTLPVGRYVIEAAYGDATQSKDVEVRPGQITTTDIILNAGQLRGTARLSAKGAPVSSYWRVYKAEGYELGERQQVTYSAEGQFTLPAGRYIVEVEHGEAKGHAEVTVQAGEINPVDIVLGAAS
ncbi:MAG TPA: TIR domain-containing protein [Methylomirabilota bacterium]|nr:TIR domain-containing protein [Methylomirabilota bacterium]